MKNLLSSSMVMLMFFSFLLLATLPLACAQTNAGEVVGTVEPLIKPSPCYNGVQDVGEDGVDCGGTCVTNDTELCDSIDNNRNCVVDEAKECLTKNADNETGSNVTLKNGYAADQQGPQPTSEPTIAPTSSASGTAGDSAFPIAIQSDESSGKVSDVGISPFYVDVEQRKDIRTLAKENNIYLPEDESDEEILKKYTLFTEKHEAELAAKFEGESMTEEETVELLRQFSEETYSKETRQQPQSFFSAIINFFKKLFR